MNVDTLNSDLAAAIKARDAAKVTGLRGVLTAIRVAETSGAAAVTLDSDQIVSVIAKEVRDISDMAASFRDNGRLDRAEAAEATAAALSVYLPAEMSDAELAANVERIVTEAGATSMADMGAVMKAAKAQLDGVDGRRLSAAVRSRLG